MLREFMVNVGPEDIDWDALLQSVDDEPIVPRTVRVGRIGFLELERQVRVLADKLLPDGSKVRSFDRRGFATANYAYKCEHPFAIEKIGYWCPISIAVKRGIALDRDGVWYPKPLVRGLREILPCRKCQGCRERNKAAWFSRAREEFYASQCTWMATFTLSPLERAVLEKRAIALHHQNSDGRKPTRDDVLKCSVRVFGRMVTTWLRSVTRKGRRKDEPEISAKDRPYVLVAEQHQDGSVHFHGIFHEKWRGVLFGLEDCEWRTEDGYAISTEHLIGAQLLGAAPAVTNYYAKDDCRGRQLWRFGFTKFRLLRKEADLNYAVKYLDAIAGTRIRASSGYGKDCDDPAPGPFDDPERYAERVRLKEERRLAQNARARERYQSRKLGLAVHGEIVSTIDETWDISTCCCTKRNWEHSFPTERWRIQTAVRRGLEALKCIPSGQAPDRSTSH